ncbi:hypothetical protein DSAG12_03906 [Promethearchaeum syntrophicum]|uniref:Uncharacterized protein n=1 Tax=Promethearchaeum syntrophicum TaxID=2594042 RepID=A0A5B9DFK6_9ARCH|nr:hypothetical protein [Candidatus Prometheoarchaeum syntrophicum]QEE18068.1 hypothetical protein DSAG12_03906 [Candidatus Prometheoarchaeum syntrophicum]
MSEYQNLKPIYASSAMRISKIGTKLKFSNMITYDYFDIEKDNIWKNYKEFLKKPSNYESELQLYWSNLQSILDDEINKINEEEVFLKIIHCTIQFRDICHPYVQWIIEFEGNSVEGQNIYENYVDDEILEYPIYSLYVFEKPLAVTKIFTSLQYNLSGSNRIIEYFGEPNNKLDGYEAIFFQ